MPFSTHRHLPFAVNCPPVHCTCPTFSLLPPPCYPSNAICYQMLFVTRCWRFIARILPLAFAIRLPFCHCRFCCSLLAVDRNRTCPAFSFSPSPCYLTILQAPFATYQIPFPVACLPCTCYWLKFSSYFSTSKFSIIPTSANTLDQPLCSSRLTSSSKVRLGTVFLPFPNLRAFIRLKNSKPFSIIHAYTLDR
ncbi:hypothetical protein H4582DRAFT_107328 [Lactarius indigo]|nr:hypothetical protein H4582DRAFT_107328 [Lactarius indigo]